MIGQRTIIFFSFGFGAEFFQTFEQLYVFFLQAMQLFLDFFQLNLEILRDLFDCYLVSFGFCTVVQASSSL